MSSDPPPAPRGTMSLYANLLDPTPDGDTKATISRAPVLFTPNETPKKPIDPALRFQPIRRPVANTKKPGGIKIGGFPKVIPASTATKTSTTASAITSATSTTAVIAAAAVVGLVSAAVGTTQPQRPSEPPAPSAPAPSAPAPATKSTLADWTGKRQEDTKYFHGGAGGGGADKKRRNQGKKKKNRKDERVETDWDEFYDPARPTNVEEYVRSDERVVEVREWRDVLYRLRRERRAREEEDGDREMRRRSYSGDDVEEKESSVPRNNIFAPPPSYAFAPPPPESPPRQAKMVNDATGDDAYARRIAMSSSAAHPAPPPQQPPQAPSMPPTTTIAETISRAPVKYTQPDPGPMDEDDDSYSPPPVIGDTTDPQQEPSSNRPRQAGFANRLMTKYGWTSGSGLGATESGIVNPLQVKLEKRRKRPDSEGGGWAEPGGCATIVGGKVSKATREREKQQEESANGGAGKMSAVVVLGRMLEGMSEEELEGEIREGTLQQEIGEEIGEKYGRVERLVVDVEGKRVFVRFVDGVSGLRAVTALQGRIFNGNPIVARFFDEEKFERRELN